MSVAEKVLLALLALELYTYLGYGIILYVLIRIKRLLFPPPPLKNPEEWPEVALVIPAFNEGNWITEKARNSLELDYPKDKLDILFITDGSSDGSERLLNGIPGIRYSHQQERRGKAAAENRAMKLITAPIVVFCDANTLLNTGAVKALVRHYGDPRVGGVSGEKRILVQDTDGASGSGEGLYWKYESTLKKWDAELWSLVGAAGELVSFRSDLMEDLEEDSILDDFMQSMRIAARGYRFMYEPQAYALERPSADVSEELKRKYRIAAGGWQSMARLWRVLLPFPHPVLTWQYISHRVLRWSVSAFALPVLFLLTAYCVWAEPETGLWQLLLLTQLGFYGLAGAGWYLNQKGKKSKLAYVPYYFALMNYAVWVGFFRFLRGKQGGIWERARRAAP